MYSKPPSHKNYNRPSSSLSEKQNLSKIQEDKIKNIQRLYIDGGIIRGKDQQNIDNNNIGNQSEKIKSISNKTSRNTSNDNIFSFNNVNASSNSGSNNNNNTNFGNTNMSSKGLYPKYTTEKVHINSLLKQREINARDIKEFTRNSSQISSKMSNMLTNDSYLEDLIENINSLGFQKEIEGIKNRSHSTQSTNNGIQQNNKSKENIYFANGIQKKEQSTILFHVPGGASSKQSNSSTQQQVQIANSHHLKSLILSQNNTSNNSNSNISSQTKPNNEQNTNQIPSSKTVLSPIMGGIYYANQQIERQRAAQAQENNSRQLVQLSKQSFSGDFNDQNILIDDKRVFSPVYSPKLPPRVPLQKINSNPTTNKNSFIEQQFQVNKTQSNTQSFSNDSQKSNKSSSIPSIILDDLKQQKIQKKKDEYHQRHSFNEGDRDTPAGDTSNTRLSLDSQSYQIDSKIARINSNVPSTAEFQIQETVVTYMDQFNRNGETNKDNQQSQPPPSSQIPVLNPIKPPTQVYNISGSKIKPVTIPTEIYDAMKENLVNGFAPVLTARCWTIFDANTVKPIDSQNAHVVREVASITKIMTCYITIRFCERLEIDMKKLKLKVSQYASSIIGTSAQLKQGVWMNLWDLLHGLMLPSGNDAAVAIAENIGALMNYDYKNKWEEVRELLYYPETLNQMITENQYSIPTFLNMMNRTSKEVGMLFTTYANPHGLANQNNKSTAFDVAQLSCKVLLNEKFVQIVNTFEYSCEGKFDNNDKQQFKWTNGNKLLPRGWEGVQTGWTDVSGPCLSSSLFLKSNINSSIQHYVIVVLNCKSLDIRWEECEKLAVWALQKDQSTP